MTIDQPLHCTRLVVPLPADCHPTEQRSFANEFLEIWVESHRALGILQQLWLAVWYGRTYRLYTLLS